MPNWNDLMGLVRSLSGRPASALSPASTLASLGLSSSIRLLRLQTLAEAVAGKQLPPVRAHVTLRELQSLVDGEPSRQAAPAMPRATPAAEPASHASGTLSVGTDI